MRCRVECDRGPVGIEPVRGRPRKLIQLKPDQCVNFLGTERFKMVEDSRNARFSPCRKGFQRLRLKLRPGKLGGLRGQRELGN